MFPNIRADIRRYTSMAGPGMDAGQVIDLICTQGIWALAVYRFGAWAHRLRIPVFASFLKVIYFLLQKMIEIVTGISISSTATIGDGLYIGHFGGIFINASARVGRNCSIGTGVTIGTRGLGRRGAPVIGDNVFIGVGAKVLGAVTVGSNSRIGANAVVINDVPEGATAVGVPARVVNKSETAFV